MPSTSRSSSSSTARRAAPPRILLLKSLYRALRTLRTEARLLFEKPLYPRPYTLPLFVVLAVLAVVFLLLRAFLVPLLVFEPALDSHFTHNVHAFLPPPKDFDAVAARRCSWLYAEFAARDARFLNAFATHGNGFLEEYLRATQSSFRAFCVVAFDPDPLMSQPLNQVRNLYAKKAANFHVFTQLVPSAFEGNETITFHAPNSFEPVDDPIPVRSFDLKKFIDGVTYKWQDSGDEVHRMNMARGNRNIGNVVIRFNVFTMREAYWYLQLLEVLQPNGLACSKIDRLIFDFKRVDLQDVPLVEDRDPVRNLDMLITPPSSPELDPARGFAGIVDIAAQISQRKACRTVFHVIDDSGKMVYPPQLSERNVYYAVLAGQPTFDERVSAQTETWMTAVPKDRLTIFTNSKRNPDELSAARGRTVAVVQPHRPELELRLLRMQSWSHLVRVRQSWDRAMKDNPEIKWLALVDDDTFVFPGGMRQYLSGFDSRVKMWSGSPEQARIDNGDSGVFATWLREQHLKYGGRNCYMRNETVPKHLIGARIEYVKSKVLNGRRVMRKVSHMCHDTFCTMGCAAVPQGAAVLLSRAMVEALRSHIEQCEIDTRMLCKSCGSQRLYMCVNRYIEGGRTILSRGICRSPWKLEHRTSFPFVLTFHGFNRHRKRFLSTDSLRGDMVELWRLGKTVEERVKRGLLSSYLIPMQKIADLVGCHNQAVYKRGRCITAEGIDVEATDGKKSGLVSLPFHHASDRKGSA